MANCSEPTRKYKFVPFELAQQFEALAAKRGVSKVARGEEPSSRTNGGFFQAAKRANGSIEKLRKMPAGNGRMWWDERNNFCKRHHAQKQSKNEPVVEKNDKNYKGTPTRRELGMIMWMCSNLTVEELRAMLPLVRKIAKNK